MEYDKNVDGNLAALNKYLTEQDKEESAYEAMIDELNEEIGVLLMEAHERHEAIVKKYGFEQKFTDTIGEIL